MISSSAKGQQQSPFSFRMVYYGPATDQAYADAHGVRRPRRNHLETVDAEWGLWVHTMHRFVPPEDYFATHPEYFAERNGARIQDQLCLTEPAVLELTVFALRRMMAEKPDARYWSVSQMDNYNHCQCARCKAIDDAEGSPSGTVVRFANQVAERFPDKVISTLAYQYSRAAPKVTRPLPNVNIMLCSIEENRSKPMRENDGPGSFTADLRAWTALTKNIVVWDYVINFAHLLSPFPNWKVLQPNIQLFRDVGVTMVFEQGLPSTGGEMPEFRCYLLARLLNDPDSDVDALRTEFLKQHYGKAWPFLDTYTRLMEDELAKSGKPLGIYEHPQAHKDGYLSPANLAKYKALFDRAEAAVVGEDAIYKERVEAARLPIEYAELEVARAMQGTGHGLLERDAKGQWKPKRYFVDLLDDFVAKAKKHGNARLHETRLPPDQYRVELVAFLKHSAVRHRAVGASISFVEPPHENYTGGSPSALIDGFRATTEHQFAWQGWWGKDMVATVDLGRVSRIGEVAVGLLEIQPSWIFLPAQVVIETSIDGNAFAEFGRKEYPLQRQSGPPRIDDAIFRGRASARYIRVTAIKRGALPPWHGSKGDAWLFCDEIVVR